MKKQKLTERVEARKATIKEALETVISCITAKGQRKKIIKDPTAKELLDFYGVDIEA